MVKEDPEVAKQDPQRVGTLKLSLIDKQLIALHLIGWRGGEEGGWIQGAQDFSGRDWPEILILGFFKEKSLIQLWPGEENMGKITKSALGLGPFVQNCWWSKK